jgi:D-alanyl-D-alanine dipeptidase/lipoprotein-anchoring transpeptidase ErfK/SrfK
MGKIHRFAILVILLILCFSLSSCWLDSGSSRSDPSGTGSVKTGTSDMGPINTGTNNTEPTGTGTGNTGPTGTGNSSIGPTATGQGTEPQSTGTAPVSQESPYRIYIEKGSHTMTIFKRDANGEYTEPVNAYRVSIGSKAEPTPEGSFSISRLERWHQLPSGKYVQYASFFGENLFISSCLYDTDDINTLYRESYISVGDNITAGSIYTTTGAANWIFENCPAGTEVLIVDGSPLNTTSEEPRQLNTDYYFTDPTDPLRPEINPPQSSDYKIYIEKGSFTITVFAKDENGNYTKPVRIYPTAVGKTAGRTPAGTFEIGEKERWHTFPAPFIGGYAQYASHFYNTLLIHSPIYGLQDIQYMVPESYQEIGTMCTAGCLRTTTEGAYWIYTYCPAGTVVEIVNGSPMGLQMPELPEPDPSYPWKDPTDPFRPVSEWKRTGVVKAPGDDNFVFVKSGPGDEYARIGKLLNGARITVLDEYQGWYKVNFFNEVAYIKKDSIRLGAKDLEPFSEALYAYQLPAIEKPVFEKEAGKELINDFVDLRSFIDTIEINLVFATENNFSGKKLYPLDVCLLQRGTAEKLKKAQELFQKDGYRIKIYDAYRPYSIQPVLFDIIQDKFYIADPNNASLHNRGAAVDMTLVGPDGNELVMPSPVHTFSPEAHVDNPNMSEEARKNLEYMQSIMVQCGFYVYQYEWWHFTDLDCLKYMVTDYNFTEIIFSDKPRTH